MGVIYQCVHCASAGKVCLNRSLRILNFAHQAEIEARARGSFMVARVANSLFQIALRTREWDSEHLAVIDAHFDTIENLSTRDENDPGETLIGEALLDSASAVEAWVEWLEHLGAQVIEEHGSSFDCLRRGTPAAHCSIAAACGR